MKKHTLAFGLMAALGFSTTALAAGAAQSIHVYKSPTCGCCDDWIDHLEDNGFEVEATNTNDMGRIKADAGLIAGLGSCHTAFVGDYVIEGHVPPADIHRLLSERPDAIGLSVPGMPWGSPGMGPASERDAYSVFLIRNDGTTEIFAHYNAA